MTEDRHSPMTAWYRRNADPATLKPDTSDVGEPVTKAGRALIARIAPMSGDYAVDVGPEELGQLVAAIEAQATAQQAQRIAALIAGLSDAGWTYHSEQGHPDPQNMCPEPLCQNVSRLLSESETN